MLPSRLMIHRHARYLGRRVARRSLVSVSVMVALQVGGSLSQGPHGFESTPRLTVRSPQPGAAPLAPVRRADAGGATAVASGLEARLPLPARRAAMSASLREASEPPIETAVRVASRGTAADAVMFDTCLPECESRDPLLRKASLSALQGSKAAVSSGPAEAVTAPVAATSDVAAPVHSASPRAATRWGTTVAGAAAASAIGRLARLTTWLNDR